MNQYVKDICKIKLFTIIVIVVIIIISTRALNGPWALLGSFRTHLCPLLLSCSF